MEPQDGRGRRCGRRRELFELASPNRNVRSFGERAAMNTPVQGTAADIIKLAMVQVARRLEEGGYRARLILQVHDELVVECPLAEADEVSALVQSTMEAWSASRCRCWPRYRAAATGKRRTDSGRGAFPDPA